MIDGRNGVWVEATIKHVYFVEHDSIERMPVLMKEWFSHRGSHAYRDGSKVGNGETTVEVKYSIDVARKKVVDPPEFPITRVEAIVV